MDFIYCVNIVQGVGSYNLDDSKRRHIAGIKLTAQKTKTRKDPSIDETQLGSQNLCLYYIFMQPLFIT